MDLRDLIREIHRRSIWQVLAVYAGASWAAMEAVGWVSERLLLPDWIPGLALVLVIIGLPIVLATAVVQEAEPEEPSPTGAGRELSGDRAEPSGSAREHRSTGPVPRSSRGLRRLLTWRNALRGGILAFALWGVIAAGWVVLRTNDAETGTSAQGSIAVLPLENMFGPDPQQEYFVQGLTDVLISELSKISGLIVKSHTSVMRYREAEERPSIPEIARELEAEYLIEGSVARGEDEARVTIQLIEAREDRHVWAEDYQRPLADVLKLQKEVARTIAGEIQIRLQRETSERLSETEDVDPLAREAYLKGRYHLGRHILENDPEAARASISYLRQAVERQPDWAPAHAQLARAYHWLGSGGGGPEYFDSTEAAARTALDLDPDLAVAHAALGFARLYGDLDWTGAEAAYRRALELDPNAYQWDYAIYLTAAGRYQEAVSRYRRAEEREPFAATLKGQRGWVYVCAGRPDRAIEYLQDVLELYPDNARPHAALGAAYLRRGNYDRAVAEYERAAALEPSGWRSHLGYVYATMGRTGAAREILRELEGQGAEYFPWLHVALGQPDEALAQMERAYEIPSASILFMRCVTWLGVDLTGAPALRDKPRFQKLLDRIAFPN